MFWNPFADLLSSAGGALFDDAFNKLVDGVNTGARSLLVTLGTCWIDFDPISLGEEVVRSALAETHGRIAWVAAGLMILSIIVGGARMAWERHAEPGRKLLASLALAAVMQVGTVAIVGGLIKASDEVAKQLLQAQDGKQFSDKLVAALMLDQVGGVGPALVCILALVAIVVSIVQIVLLTLRAVLLVMMMAVLPVAGSFTSLEMGRAWFQKCCGWTLAFVLYKPVAALIYSLALHLLDARVASSDVIMGRLLGLTMLVLAILALPALMKACVPAVAAAASGGNLLSGIGSGGGGQPSGAGPSGAAPAKDSGSHDSSPPAKQSTPDGAAPAPTGPGGGSVGNVASTTGGVSGPAGNAAASTAGGSAAMGGGGAAASTAGGSAAMGGGAAAASAGTTAAAGAATGGVGAAVLVAAQTAVKAAKVTKQIADNAAGIATGEGPSGSR